MTGTLERGLAAFGQNRWGDAYAALTAAGTDAPLMADELDRLALSAELTGRFDEATATWSRAHDEHLRLGAPDRAARSAFWIWFAQMNRDQMAVGAGWLARARTTLDECDLDCVERGYVRLPDAVQAMYMGESATAYPAFAEILEVADRFGDDDLRTLCRLGRGQCLLYLGDVPAGVAALDEVMATVTSRSISPSVTGLVYCALIAACRDLQDVRRAREWTVALSRWCDTQQDLVPYRGECMVHRAELMQFDGAWGDAAAEAEHAREWLLRPPPHRLAGSACYQQAEVHRLRGELPSAETAYREASRLGHEVQPGLALLRLAQGKLDAAAASIRVAVEEADDAVRPRLLPAHVEIMLAVGDIETASAAAAELSGVADRIDAEVTRAHAGHARAAVALAMSDARAALSDLRRAWMAWRSLEAPYESARARELMGHAYRLLGDEDSAELELDAARWVYQDLGAATDLARLDADPAPAVQTGGGHGLTGREIDVLRQLATGGTNRAIATELVISEKTVARHVANIFLKLGLSSRAAATAYAYEHELV